MYNKKALSKAVKNLDSAKAPAKKKDIITDPMGQWKFPGENTRIPGNDITMSGVPYPVWAVPNVGTPQMMYPGQNYNFPGANYVDEYPQMQIGGTHSTSLSDEDEMRFQKFYSTLPDNLMDDDPSYDIRGYWRSEGMPDTFDYSQPKEEDGFYHAYSINADTGEYLKAPWHPTFQHAVDEDRKIGWRPITNVYGRNVATENPSIIEREEQSFLRNTEGPIYELTDEEIQAYRDGGYIVEELPEAQTGGPYQSSIVPTKPKSVAYSKSPGVNNLDQVYTYEGRPNVTYKKDLNGNWLVSNDGQNYTAIKDPSGSRTKVLDQSAKPIQLSEASQAVKTLTNRGVAADMYGDKYYDATGREDTLEDVMRKAAYTDKDLEKHMYENFKEREQEAYDKLTPLQKTINYGTALFADPLTTAERALFYNQRPLVGQGQQSLRPGDFRDSRYYDQTLQRDENIANNLFNYVNPTRYAGEAGLDITEGNYADAAKNLGLAYLMGRGVGKGGKLIGKGLTMKAAPEALSKLPGFTPEIASIVGENTSLNNLINAEFIYEGIGALPQNIQDVYRSAIGKKPWLETAGRLGENSINFIGTGFTKGLRHLPKVNEVREFNEALVPTISGVGMKKGGEKKYSRDLTAQNKLFKDNPLTKKKKSRKKKTFDPNAKYYQEGGPYNFAGPTNELADKDYSLYLMKMKQEALRGNPAAHRMLSENPVDYTYTGDEYVYGEPAGTTPGEKGTHYMSVMDNYVVPFIQQSDSGNLEFNEYASPMDSEAIRFDSPEEAQEFSENYKKAAPMAKSFQKGGQYYMYDNKYYLKDNGQWSKFDGDKFTPLSKGNVAERVKILEKNAVKMKPSQILAHSTETSKKPTYNQLDMPQASASTTGVNMPDTTPDRNQMLKNAAIAKEQKEYRDAQKAQLMATSLASKHDNLDVYDSYLKKRSRSYLGTNPITKQKISLDDYTTQGKAIIDQMKQEGYDINPNIKTFGINKQTKGKDYSPSQDIKKAVSGQKSDITNVLSEYAKNPTSILTSEKAADLLRDVPEDTMGASKEFNPIKRAWEYATNPLTAFHYSVATGDFSNMPYGINEMKQAGIDVTPRGVPNLVGDVLNQYNPLEAGDYISRALASETDEGDIRALARALQFIPALGPTKTALGKVPGFNESIKFLETPLTKSVGNFIPGPGGQNIANYTSKLGPNTYLGAINKSLTPANMLYLKSAYELGTDIANNPRAYTDFSADNWGHSVWNLVKAGATAARLHPSAVGQGLYSNVNLPMTVAKDLKTIGKEERPMDEQEMLHLYRMVTGKKEGGEIYEDELSDEEIKRLQDLGYTIDILD